MYASITVRTAKVRTMFRAHICHERGQPSVPVHAGELQDCWFQIAKATFTEDVIGSVACDEVGRDALRM
jgi:hypothetical protein